MRRKQGYSKIPGEVHFYAGYKGRQEPRQIDMHGRVYAVTRILSRERVEEGNSGRVREAYLCRIDHRIVEVQVQADGIVEIFGEGSGDRDEGA